MHIGGCQRKKYLGEGLLNPRARRNGWRDKVLLSLIFATISFTGVLSSSWVEAAPKAQNADELLPVDCLLPGQVRRLGRQMTYVTQRRAIKTTGVDCEIRGGEYVSFDRANYATAMQIWLPLAQQGDPKAQNYVGEIHEKGLGVTPDPAQAAQWYRKAAEQDYKAAQINLGQLYEAGRGVDKDIEVALEWYRKAAGLREKQLKFVSFGYSDEAFQEMQVQLTEQDKKIKSLVAKLDASQSRTGVLEAELLRAKKNLAPEREEINRKRLELESKAKQIIKLEEQIANDRASIDAEQDAKTQELNKKLDSYRNEVSGLREELAVKEQSLQELQAALDEKSKRAKAEGKDEDLSWTEQIIIAIAEKFDLSLAKPSPLEEEIAAARAAIATEQADIERRKKQLAERADKLQNMQQQISTELAAYSAVASASSQKVQLQAQQLQQSREQLSNYESELSGKQSELQTLKAELAQYKQALQQQQQKVAAQERDSSSYQQQIAARQQEIDKRQQDIKARQLEIERRAKEVAEYKTTVADQQRQLAQLKHQTSSQQQQLQDQQKQIETTERVSEARRLAVESAQKRLEQYRLQVSDLGAELHDKEQALAKREQALSEKSQALLAAKLETDRLRSEVEKNRIDIASTNRSGQQLAANDAPIIKMIEPKILSTRGDFVLTTRSGLDQRTIIGQVLSGVNIMSVLVNEEDVSLDSKGFFQKRIPLGAKETKVSIVAVNELGKRAELAFAMKPESAPQTLVAKNIRKDEDKKLRPIPDYDFGGYYALVIGNRAYQHLPRLTTTIRDAEAVSDLLKNKYGFNVTLLKDATRYDILSALNEMRAKLTDKDNLLIYYAGHGELDRVNNRGNWLPVDAEEQSTANWISNIAITDILNAMSAKKVLVVADSCYSGAMTRSTLARLDAGRSDEAWLSWIKLQAEKHSRLSLSSGGLAPVLDGGGGRHSIFAKAFLDALEANKEVVEGRQIHSQVAQAVSYAASAAQFEQTPQYAPIKYAGHEAGDFLFVPRHQ